MQSTHCLPPICQAIQPPALSTPLRAPGDGRRALRVHTNSSRCPANPLCGGGRHVPPCHPWSQARLRGRGPAPSRPSHPTTTLSVALPAPLAETAAWCCHETRLRSSHVPPETPHGTAPKSHQVTQITSPIGL